MLTARVLAISILTAGLAVAPAYGGSEKSGADTGARPLSKQLDDAFRDLMEQMKPALDEFMDSLKVLEGIGGIDDYQRPEILPNGDIIIRRREDAPPLPQDDGSEPGEDPATAPGVRT